MAAVARRGENNFELPPRGFPLPVSVGKKAPGEELPGAADVDFSRPVPQEIGRRDVRWERGRHKQGSPREELAFGVSFWG